MTSVILVWGWLAVLAAGTKLSMLHRRLTGKLGLRRRAECRMLASAFGGVRSLALTLIALSVLAPPLILGGCLRTYQQDRGERR